MSCERNNLKTDTGRFIILHLKQPLNLQTSGFLENTLRLHSPLTLLTKCHTITRTVYSAFGEASTSVTSTGSTALPA